ncbi:hypothetical protein ACFX13_024768 [Malus domestica]
MYLGCQALETLFMFMPACHQGKHCWIFAIFKEKVEQEVELYDNAFEDSFTNDKSHSVVAASHSSDCRRRSKLGGRVLHGRLTQSSVSLSRNNQLKTAGTFSVSLLSNVTDAKYDNYFIQVNFNLKLIICLIISQQLI